MIIAAGGLGSRMGTKLPKQFLKIGGQPILKKTADVFCKNPAVDGICIVTNRDYVRFTEKLFDKESYPKLKCIVSGGEKRQDSVAEGLRALAATMPDYEYVMIHDAARPYVTDAVIANTLDMAIRAGASVAAVPVKDTVRHGNMTLEREELYIVQTPQTFERSIIENAYTRAYSDGYYGTDDGSVVERTGLTVAIAEGDYGNIKITTGDDMPMERRVGTGYDVHRLTENRALVLGGVRIPFEKGLLGHSDADVLTHAVMDALLGAAALGDIGRHFPDTDVEYKDISSMKLLARVRELLEEEGYTVCNIDAVIMAQHPKVTPFAGEMKSNIAAALNMNADNINIKATTTEGLGFVGREEGIAAHAVCMIEGEERR